MDKPFCFTVLLLLITSAFADESDDTLLDKNCKIGFGFYLPRYDVLGTFNGGTKLYEPFEYNKCIVSIPRNEHQSGAMHYSDVSKFFDMVTTRTGIAKSLKGKYTLGTTFNEKSASIAAENFQTIGASVYIHYYARDEVLSADCQNSLKLNSHFKSRFENLPLVVDTPYFRSSWSEYETFLQTFGSHFASRTVFGSRIEQWNFAKSSKRYSQTQMMARACADFLGADKYKDVNIKECNGFDPDTIKSSTRLETSSKFTLLGGSHTARTKLLLKRSRANIQLFLDSATPDTEIGYKFTGIWDLLKKRYIGTQHYAKALNLEYFFKGFLDMGCSYKKDESNTMVLRRFSRAEDYRTEKPAYKCEIPSRGCTTNSDCHLGGPGGTWAVCYCYGKSCIDHKTTTVANRGIIEAYSKVDYDWQSHWVGTHASCDYQIGVWCSCNQRWGGFNWRNIWTS